MIRNDIEAADAWHENMHPELEHEDEPEECSVATHEALKADGRWNSMATVGVMPTYDEPGQPQHLVLKDCPYCHSTLAKEAP